MFNNTHYTTVKSDNTTYVVTGNNQDGVPLIMLHGLFGGLSNYDMLLDECSKNPVKAYIPELPIFELKYENLSMATLKEWLYNFIRTKGISKVHLLGNSLGGQLALEFALSYPGLVDKLILTGSSGIRETQITQSLPRRFDRNYIRQQAAYTFYDREVSKETVDEIEKILQDRHKLLNIIKLAREVRDTDLSDKLSRIYHEVLIIWGEDDNITPPDVAVRLEKLLPDATLKWISRCGHAPMMERPEVFAEILKSFLEDKKNIYI